MAEILIRKAVNTDMEILLEFEQGVINAERPFDPTLKSGHIHYYDLDMMINAEHIALLVAEWKGRVVASGYARIEGSKPFLKHNRHAYLGFMFVHPDHRGKGINNKLIEALKQWSFKQGISELRLDVYFQNESAIRAYEKSGFKKHMIEMAWRK
jgi:GNAT superfamily N-acetyltransferase